jgi:hypothetical protein
MKLPDGMPETIPTELVLSFVQALQLADHVGDVGNYLADFLEVAGIELEVDEEDDETPYWSALEKTDVPRLGELWRKKRLGD